MSANAPAGTNRPLVTLVIADKALDVRGTANEFRKEFLGGATPDTMQALEELIGNVYEHGRNHPKPPQAVAACPGPAASAPRPQRPLTNEYLISVPVVPVVATSTKTTVGAAIRVNGRDFIITEIRDGKGKHDAGRPVYILSGKRGARYATCRNVHHPDMMFLVTERGFGIPAGWENVWLTDASGALVAGGS
jgi:hypothetical protein